MDRARRNSSRMARGPNRAPGLWVTASSNGAPTMATSTPPPAELTGRSPRHHERRQPDVGRQVESSNVPNAPSQPLRAAKSRSRSASPGRRPRILRRRLRQTAPRAVGPFTGAPPVRVCPAGRHTILPPVAAAVVGHSGVVGRMPDFTVCADGSGRRQVSAASPSRLRFLWRNSCQAAATGPSAKSS